jgi:hypothetical protein
MKYVDNIDKEIESVAGKMAKGKKSSKKSIEPTPKGRDGKYITAKDPKDAMGWLKKAYIDNDPSDGAPKVGDIGYV